MLDSDEYPGRTTFRRLRSAVWLWWRRVRRPRIVRRCKTIGHTALYEVLKRKP